MKIEVGKFYMCANGEIVGIDSNIEIDSNLESGNELLWAKNGMSYHISGRYGKDAKSESEYDLIAEIPKELHQHLIKEVMNYWQDEDFRNTVNNVYGGDK